MKKQNESDRLKPLKEYIIDLYLVGGIPLVLIGLSAVNLFFVPYSEDLESHRGVISLTLVVIGGFIWAVSTVIAQKKSVIEMQIDAKRDEIITSTICGITKDAASDVVKDKLDALSNALQKYGIEKQTEQDSGEE